MTSRVAVVGAGIAGASCASALRDSGVNVDVYERGRTAGGRMASPTMGERRVDLGAAYFTVADDGFAAVVETWRADGLAREWTDTFDVFTPGERSSTTGPVRWAAGDGMRSLVRALDPRAEAGSEITGVADLDHDAVVLAMPDPQAARLAPDGIEWVAYEPVIAVAAAWDERAWTLESAGFVNDDPDITLIADDGSRRGDGAPVLVVHTTGDLARRHLDEPDGAVVPALDALRRTLGIDRPPIYTYAHRWTFAKPAGTHADQPFGLLDHEGRPLGVCSDSWCPEGSPRVESAWLSGHRLGTELAARLP